MSDINLFEIFGKIILDDSDFNKKTKEAAATAKSLSSKLGSGLSKAADIGGKALKVTAKAAVALTTATATGIAALTKAAVDNYGEYQQMVGGVETLFGAGSQSIEEFAKSQGKSVAKVQKEYDALMKSQETVFKNARIAYRTAGLSANEYMETATSFAASLVQSLSGDTQAAAELADVAVRDMADNANKMGTSMESIQNAYQGFAKQNYTMLDNLNTMGALAA